MKQPNFWQSLKHAWSGLIFTVSTQRNARIHLVAGTAALALAFVLGLEASKVGLLVLTIGAVIATETINTAIEAMVDLLSPEWHQQAKIAKDVAAGAVLIMSLTAILIGLLLLGPPLWSLLEARIKVT